MIQIIGDIKRAVFSRPFLIAYGGMVLCLIIGAFSDALSVFRMEKVHVLYGYHRELLLNALSSDIILFAVPILAAIPYTTAFTDDVKSGYLKPYLTRTSVTNYILGKGIGAAVSGGEQQRVAIARALASGSKIILADEPTGNLDSENGKNIVEILKRLAHEENCCVVVVTHDPSVAAEADALLKMKDGKIEQE